MLLFVLRATLPRVTLVGSTRKRLMERHGVKILYGLNVKWLLYGLVSGLQVLVITCLMGTR